MARQLKSGAENCRLGPLEPLTVETACRRRARALFDLGGKLLATTDALISRWKSGRCVLPSRAIQDQQKPAGVFTSASPRCLDGGDIDLVLWLHIGVLLCSHSDRTGAVKHS